MRRCQFSGSSDSPCPVPENWPYGLVNQSCKEDEYGQACAAIIAQYAVANTLNPTTLESKLDEVLGLICGQFRLTQTPLGDAPENVRTVVGRGTFPLREKRPVEEGRIFVSHEDVVLTLMNNGDLEAANWYQRYLVEQTDGTQALWWGFNDYEGVVHGAHPEEFWQRTSVQEYDHSFRLGNAALWNSHFPPLLIMSDPHRGRSSTIPIKEHLSNMHPQS